MSELQRLSQEGCEFEGSLGNSFSRSVPWALVVVGVGRLLEI